MLIDEFMREYQVSERHQIQANGPIEIVQKRKSSMSEQGGGRKRKYHEPPGSLQIVHAESLYGQSALKAPVFLHRKTGAHQAGRR